MSKVSKNPKTQSSVSKKKNIPKAISSQIYIRWGLIAVFLFVCLFIFIRHAIYLNCVAEDSYITFRFAQNLAHGYGFVWNIGEPPVEGYTNFLWVIICAGIFKSGLDLPFTSQVLGVIFGCLSIFYLFKLTSCILGRTTPLCLIPGLFLALCGPFASWASSGMETSLFSLLLIMAVYYYLLFIKTLSFKNANLSLMTMFFATLTRPEGLIIPFITFCLTIFMFKGNQKTLKRYLLSFLIFFLVPFLVYFCWRLTYFGFLLPNTFYAKTGGGVEQYKRGLAYLGYFSFFYLIPLIPFLVLFLWEGKEPEWRLNPNTLLLLSICLIYTIYIIFVGGDYMAMFRFFVPIIPFIYTFIGLGIGILWTGMTKYKQIVTLGLLATCLLATVVQSTPFEKNLFVKPPLMHGNYQGILIERWHSQRLCLLGKFFDKYKSSPNESLSTNAIGAIAYFSGLKIYDVHGIVDTHIAHVKMGGLGQRLAGHEKADFMYILSKKPTFIMYERYFTPAPLSIEELTANRTPQERDIIFKNYKPSSQWVVDEQSHEQGYFSFLELKERK